MKPKTDEVTKKLPVNQTIAEEQEDYLTIPAHVTPEGMLCFAMELDKKELEQIQKSKTIYVNLITFNRPMPPIALSVDPDDFDETSAETDAWLKQKFQEWLKKQQNNEEVS